MRINTKINIHPIIPWYHNRTYYYLKNTFLLSLLLFLLQINQSTGSNNNHNNKRIIPPKTVLTWVNGIGHTMNHMTNGQIKICSLFGNRPVLFCHNPTAMTNANDTRGYIGDLTQATTQKLGKITAEVDALVRHLKEAVQKVGPKGRVIHIAHSQGALITYLAVKQLTKQEISQMEVICFGGAEALECTTRYPFARCINYYSINDPLLFVVPSASKALRSGFMGVGGMKHHKTRGRLSTASSIAALVDPEVEPEFVFLTPRAGDPIKDHGLFGPTYIDALRWEGRRYMRLYLPFWHPVTQFVVRKSQSVSDVMIIFFKVVLKNTIVPIIMFVMMVNGWIKENVIIPIALFWNILIDKLFEIIRIVRGEEVYETVVINNIPSSSSSTELIPQPTSDSTSN